MDAAPWAHNVALRREPAGLALERRPLAPDPHRDVTFRVLTAAVCGTDRQILRGDREDRAAILGHEGVAEVVQAPTTGPLRVGDRVVFNPVNPGDQDEILGHSTDGLFQQFLSLPAAEVARRALAVGIAADIAAERAVLAEPLGTVVYSHEIMAAEGRPRSLVILGAGPVGILHTLYAQRAGVARVRLVHNEPARATWLVQRGLLTADDLVAWNDLARGNGAAPADAVLVCVPRRSSTAAVAAAVRLAAADACIGLVGGADAAVAGLPGVDLAQVRRRHICGLPGGGMVRARAHDGKSVRLFGHRGTAARHLTAALAALAADAAYAGVLSHRVTLGALPGALAEVARSRDLAGAHFVKALVDCRDAGSAVQPLPGGAA